MEPCPRCGYDEDLKGYEDPWKLCPKSSPEACSSCQEMDALNDEISRTRAALHNLLNRRRELSAKLNADHPSPIQRLPVEILTTIFTIYASDAYKSRCDSPFDLGSVCRKWREVAWSTPSIWTFLRIVIPQVYIRQTRKELVEEWIRRSGSLPLSVTLHGEHLNPSNPMFTYFTFQEIINILNQECTRWRSLDLSLPKELLSRFDFAKSDPAVLQELKLDSPTGEVLDIQPLELLAVRNLDVSGPILNLVNLNFTNLTAITLRSVALDQIIYILESVPQLLACRLQNVTMRAVEEPRRAYHHVVHSKLRSLEFKCGYRNPMTIVFDALTLPALQHLQFGYLKEGQSISAIVSFLRRSSNSIKSLSLNMTKITGKDLVLLLRATPSLQDLKLTHSPRDAENLFDLAEALTSHLSTSENVFLPFLQTFDWFGDVGFPWTFLPSLFAPLLPNDDTPRRPLQKVKIYCNLFDEPYEVPYVDEDILAQLSKFSDQVHFRFEMPLEYDVADLWKMSLDKWRHSTRDEEVCVV